MVNNSIESLDRVFGALADPTRRAIVLQLSHGEQRVTKLAAPFSSSLPAISKHLSVLETAGIITRRSVGRERVCRLEAEAILRAADWIERTREFWTERLDRLETMLEEEEE